MYFCTSHATSKSMSVRFFFLIFQNAEGTQIQRKCNFCTKTVNFIFYVILLQPLEKPAPSMGKNRRPNRRHRSSAFARLQKWAQSFCRIALSFGCIMILLKYNLKGKANAPWHIYRLWTGWKTYITNQGGLIIEPLLTQRWRKVFTRYRCLQRANKLYCTTKKTPEAQSYQLSVVCSRFVKPNTPIIRHKLSALQLSDLCGYRDHCYKTECLQSKETTRLNNESWMWKTLLVAWQTSSLTCVYLPFMWPVQKTLGIKLQTPWPIWKQLKNIRHW